MLVGIGIDIVETARIKKTMEKEHFLERFFTFEERVYCESRKSQKYASYSARFAAKEALVKAFGSGFRQGKFTDISVENDEMGCPSILLKGHYLELMQQKKVKKIHLSLSHSKQWAIAQVILEG